PADPAQQIAVAADDLFAELVGEQRQQRAQSLERLARLVYRLGGGAGAVVGREHLDRQLELSQGDALEPLSGTLARQEREAAFALLARPRHATVALGDG